MCLIAYGKKSDICDLDLGQAWRVNPDGAGIIIPGKKPKVFKGIMKFKQLHKIFEHISDNTEIGLHLRAATHGQVNESNTHPFRIGPVNWLMHNGMLSGLGSLGKTGSSDSAELAAILKHTRVQDRSKLLDLLPGKYLQVNANKVVIHGAFEKLGDVRVSNTYWQYTPSMYAIGTPGTSVTGVTARKPWPFDPSESRYLLNRQDWIEND